MKPPTHNPINSFQSSSAFSLLGYNAKAVNQYFDANGTAAVMASSMAAPTLGMAQTGLRVGRGNATQPGVPGSFARFPGGASGNNYTVTVANSESMAGLFMSVSGVTLNINASGAGNLNVVTAAGGQGFLLNGPVIINAPIVAAAGWLRNITPREPLSPYLRATRTPEEHFWGIPDLLP